MNSLNLVQNKGQQSLIPAARPSSLRPLTRDIVSEHLSVKLVIADLLEITGREDKLEPPSQALPEPNRQPAKDTEREVSDLHSGPAREVSSDDMVKLLAQLLSQATPRAGRA